MRGRVGLDDGGSHDGDDGQSAVKLDDCHRGYERCRQRYSGIDFPGLVGRRIVVCTGSPDSQRMAADKIDSSGFYSCVYRRHSAYFLDIERAAGLIPAAFDAGNKNGRFFKRSHDALWRDIGAAVYPPAKAGFSKCRFGYVESKTYSVFLSGSGRIFLACTEYCDRRSFKSGICFVRPL
mgnify:CR=1 FL=1